MYALSDNPLFQAYPGFGATAVQEGTAIGGAVASSALAYGVAIGAVAGPAGALIGAGIALVATLINTLVANSGCGITCVETSQWANQAEPLLLQNVQAYFAQPEPRSLSSQAAALANFDTVWNTLKAQCSQTGTGDAGKACISDRQAGACTWKQTSTSPLLAYVQYGEPNVGECWNWFSGYRDPIANDTIVVEDSQSALAQGAADTSASVLSSVGVSSSYAVPLLIGAAILVTWLVIK